MFLKYRILGGKGRRVAARHGHVQGVGRGGVLWVCGMGVVWWWCMGAVHVVRAWWVCCIGGVCSACMVGVLLIVCSLKRIRYYVFVVVCCLGCAAGVVR